MRNKEKKKAYDQKYNREHLEERRAKARAYMKKKKIEKYFSTKKGVDL